jgi:hypothetical protein
LHSDDPQTLGVAVKKNRQVALWSLGFVHPCLLVPSTLLVSAGIVVIGTGVQNLIEKNRGKQRQKNLPLQKQIRQKFAPGNDA